MTKKDFFKLAQPQPFVLATKDLFAQPIFTPAGSSGWLWQGAVLVPVGDEWLKTLASLRLTAWGSKKWPHGA
jgi:hypothetical protein